MSEPGQRALEHLARSAHELALALAAGVSVLGGRGVSLERVRAALRAEEKRWAERAARDPAAEQVREIFAALSDAIAPSVRKRRGRESGGFDRSRGRWDTRD
jgi:hypothetical protein